MKKSSGTKAELLEEISALKQKIKELEYSDSDRKQTAEMLLSASNYNRNLIEVSLDPLVTISHDGKIMDVSASTEQITGCSRLDLIGTDFSDYFTDPEKAREGYQKVFVEGKVTDYPLAVRHASGAITEVLYNASVYRNEQGEVIGVFAAARDITERKRAEDKLRGVLVELERSNKDLEQFASIASHDLQEPLRMVASYTQLLAERYEGQLDEKAKKYIAYAVEGAIRMQRLVNDLLTYSRVSTRGNPIETTDSHSILGEAIRNLAATIEESKAIVTNEELPMVRADALQLVQVFQNLLANAIKFRGENFPHIHVSVRENPARHRAGVAPQRRRATPALSTRARIPFPRPASARKPSPAIPAARPRSSSWATKASATRPWSGTPPTSRTSPCRSRWTRKKLPW